MNVKSLEIKLPSAVNNDSIRCFGDLILTFKDGGVKGQWGVQSFIYYNDDTTSKAVLEGNGYFTGDQQTGNDGTEVVNSQKYPMNGDYGKSALWRKEIKNGDKNTKVILQNKYSLACIGGAIKYTDGVRFNTPNYGISFLNNNLRDFKYCTNMRALALGNTSITGSLTDLQGMTNLVQLDLNNTSVIGKLTDLQGMTNLVLLYLSNTSITGSLTDLQGMSKLQYLILPNTVTATDEQIKVFTDRGCRVTYNGKLYESTKS